MDQGMIAPSALSFRGRFTQERQRQAFLLELEGSRRRRESVRHVKTLPPALQRKLHKMGNWPFSNAARIPMQRPRELNPLPENSTIASVEEEESPPQPTQKKKINFELRRKFRRNVKLAAMIKETIPPPRKGRQALLQLTNQIVWEAVRQTLWEWPTVMSFFQQSQSDDAIAWPTTNTTKMIPTLPATVRALPHLLRTIDLNDIMIVRLLEARFPQWLPVLCKRGDDDWYLAERQESSSSFSDSPISYEDFRRGMTLSERELEEMRVHYHDRIESQKRVTERRKAREQELLKNRQWVVEDLERAFAVWPPQIRKKKTQASTSATTRARQHCALEYSIEAGRLGRKAGLAAAAISCTGVGGHVQLRSPGVRQCLFNCAREGMGFGGLSAKEIVEVCYVHCAERIQAAWRGQGLARKYAKVKALWLRLDHNLLRRVLFPWAKMALRAAATRRFCHRKVVVWRRWARAESFHNAIYRTCFWPFYVWRRDASRRIKARRKASLLRVVWHSYVKLRMLRAWNQVATKQARDRRRATRHMRERTSSLISRKVFAWHCYAKERRRVRCIWIQRPGGGEMMRRRHLKGRLARTMAVWKYWIFLTKRCRFLAASSFRQIRADDETFKDLSRAVRETGDEDAVKRERALQAFQTKRAKIPQLPGPDLSSCFLRGTESVTTLTDDQRQVCLSLCEYFEKVVIPREIGACWMKYWRAGPGALSALHAFAMERRKERVADLAYARQCRKTHFFAWKRAAAELVREDCSSVKVGEKPQGGKRRKQQTQHRRKKPAAKLPTKRGRKSLSKSEKTERYAQEKLRRETQAVKCETLLVKTRALVADARAVVEKDRETRELVMLKQQKEMESVHAFLNERDEQLREAKDTLTAYVNNLQHNTARQFVDTVYKVFSDAAHARDRAILRHTFRSLRIPWAERRSASLLRRQILRWRLHLCARLRRLDRAMPRYRELRVKWRVWELWKKTRDNHEAWRTPGIHVELTRRRSLCRSASKHAAHRGLEEYADLKSCYLRWSWYVQNRRRWRGLTAVTVRRRKLSVEAAVLAVLRANAGIPPSSKFANKRESLVRRADADIGGYRTFFLSARRQDFIYKRQRKCAQSTTKIKRIARNGPSFKKTILAFREDTRARAKLDRKLLLNAFDMRGRIVSEDSLVEEVTPQHSSNLLHAEAFKDEPVPTGCRIGSTSVVVSSSEKDFGLLGIGSTTDGDEDNVANPMHGSSSDSGHHIFRWNKAERLVALELIVGPSHIESVRFEVALFGNTGRVYQFGGLRETTTRTSQWYGEVSSSKVERVRLSGPPGTEVVGFVGRATPSRIVSLGLQVRTVTEESIFSYRWTKPLSHRADLLKGDVETDDFVDEHEERCVVEFATMLRYRDIDLTDAAARTEAFARRLWSSRLVSSQSEFSPLQKLSVIAGLARWLLSSLASPLPPLPDSKTSVNKDEMAQATLQEKRANVERRSAERLEKRVFARRAAHDKMMTQNEEMRVQRAMQTPQWRKAEGARVLRDDRDLATAASTHALAIFRIAEAQSKQRRAKECALRIDPRAPRVRKYYTRLLATARHEVETDRSDAASRIDDDFQPIALSTKQLHSAIESALCCRQRTTTAPVAKNFASERP